MARLDALDEGNTLAVFMSDHGYMWWKHELNKKRQPYDESVQIPLFLRWPGHVGPSSRLLGIAANIDIAPTVYDAAGITPTYRPDGHSLLGGGERRYVLTEYYRESEVPSWKALWSPDEVYVEYATGFRESYAPDDPWQLSNLYRDGIDGNEPNLHDLLVQQSACSGEACMYRPGPNGVVGECLPGHHSGRLRAGCPRESDSTTAIIASVEGR